MNAEELLAKVEELLGFRVTERENDAVVEGISIVNDRARRWVRPASQQEVLMFLRLLGLVQRTYEQQKALDEGVTTIARQAEQIRMMGASLQSADNTIKELAAANRAFHEAFSTSEAARLGEELKNLRKENEALKDRNEELAEKADDLLRRAVDAEYDLKIVNQDMAEMAKEARNA